MANKYSPSQMKAFGERNRAVARDYRAGMSLREVATAHNVTAERVHQILTALGVPRRQPGGQTYRHAPLRPRLPWREEIAERLHDLRQRADD